MSISRYVRVLAVQPALRWLQPMPNMHLLRQTIKAQAAAGLDVVVLPEVFNGVPCDYDPAAGPAARRFLATLARACRAIVVGGSIDYAWDDGAWRNTCFVVDRDGREVGACHKRVLFSAERQTRRAGGEPGIFEVDGLRIGVLICADLWEPACARQMLDRVDILCVPAKTSVPTQAHADYARRLWWNLALTRAMENGLSVIVSDWCEARHEATALADGTKVRRVHHTSGGASIVDPGKRPDFNGIQRTLPAGQPGMLAVTLDLDAVASFRGYRRSVGLLPDPRA